MINRIPAVPVLVVTWISWIACPIGSLPFLCRVAFLMVICVCRSLSLYEPISVSPAPTIYVPRSVLFSRSAYRTYSLFISVPASCFIRLSICMSFSPSPPALCVSVCLSVQALVCCSVCMSLCVPVSYSLTPSVSLSGASSG